MRTLTYKDKANRVRHFERQTKVQGKSRSENVRLELFKKGKEKRKRRQKVIYSGGFTTVQMQF